jgi:hypothetical protein
VRGWYEKGHMCRLGVTIGCEDRVRQCARAEVCEEIWVGTSVHGDSSAGT